MTLREGRQARRQDDGPLVAAQWDELVRTAYLLTGKRVDAEELAARALLRGGRAPRRGGAPAGMAQAARRRLVLLAVSPWQRWNALVGRLVVRRPSGAAGGPADLDRSLPPMFLACLRLPVRERATLVLRCGAGLAEAEAADALGVDVAEVRRLTARGLERLGRSVAPVPGAPDAALELDLGEQPGVAEESRS